MISKAFSGTVAKNLPTCLAVGIVLYCATGVQALAQNAAPAPAVPRVVLPGVAASPAKWSELDATQKKALAPLESAWHGLSDGHKRKWLAISKGYAALSATDQEKMHSRMVEWAALSPKDRELARLNFAQTKAVNSADRATHWEAYQALSTEEKQKLASSATTKPVGAAVTPKPVAADKLATVPITRHTPAEQREAHKALQPPGSKKPADSSGVVSPPDMVATSGPAKP